MLRATIPAGLRTHKTVVEVAADPHRLVRKGDSGPVTPFIAVAVFLV
jgi:hypothetical protein